MIAERKGEIALAARWGSLKELTEEVCEWENCKQALPRVKTKKGSPGVDGMTVEQLPEYLRSTGQRLIHRTAVRGPARTVVWQGREATFSLMPILNQHRNGSGPKAEE